MARFWKFVSKLIPKSRFKQRIKKIFYKIAFGLTVGSYRVTFIDNVNARFCRLLFWNETEGQISLSGYLKNYKIKEEDIVIDAGAYHGHFAIYAAKKVGNKGKVICFEPDPNNFRLLKKNVNLNKLNNIILIKKGLYSQDATLKITFKGAGSQIFEDADQAVEKVEVVSLDNEISKLGISKVDFIKADIEGMEIEAVKGCKNLMKKNDVNFAIASYHKIDGRKTCIELEKIFKKHGYLAFTDYPQHLTTYAHKIN